MKHVRRSAALLLATSALVTLSLACDVAFQGLNATATDVTRKSYKLASGGRLQVTVANGRIEVTPSADADTVELVAERRVRASSEQAAKEELKAFRIEERVAPDEIGIEVGGSPSGVRLGSRSREVYITVKVPRNTSVRVISRNGVVHVAGISGPVKVETTNGEITGDDLSGAVSASTANGRIAMRVTALQPDGVRLDTVNGAIELRVPADARADISARWVHGNFDVSGLKAVGESERRRYDGKLNGGGPRIDLSTTNGVIRLSS